MDFLKILKPRKNKFSEELITQSVVDLEVQNAVEEFPEKNQDVISFKVDYLGHLLIDTLADFNADNGLKYLKQDRERKKLKAQRGVILISYNSIRLTDMRVKEILKIPILRLQSCSMDPFNKNVFFFISTDLNERKYHAFLCEKWKNAYNAAQAIAHMFSHSHEKYVKELQNKKFAIEEKDKNNEQDEDQRSGVDMMDFSLDLSETRSRNFTKDWVSFDD